MIPVQGGAPRPGWLLGWLDMIPGQVVFKLLSWEYLRVFEMFQKMLLVYFLNFDFSLDWEHYKHVWIINLLYLLY